MTRKAKWYWGGTTVLALAVAAGIITANDAWDMPDVLGTLMEGWFLVWIIIHLLVVLGWMLLHFFDGDDSNNSSGGSAGSSGVEWDRLATWYLRGRMRNQMRKFWR